ncbi:MAG: hypothetical protein ABI689_18915 [Thermoanaerobaculia bacterium]
MPIPAKEPPRDRIRDWIQLLRWPVAAVLIAGLVALVVWRVIAGIESAGRAAANLPLAAAERLGELARGLLTGNVTETFLAAIPTVAPNAGGNLEVAIAESVESLTRSDERRAFWDLVALGTTTVEIRVPVTYRYHVRLDEEWKVEIEDGFCRVLAPVLRPSLPPAIHTDRIERRVAESWLRFDAAEQLAALERQLTPRLSQLAADPRHMALVRESSRQTVARFVRAWLLTNAAWGPERVRAIQVRFADERQGGLAAPITLVVGD